MYTWTWQTSSSNDDSSSAPILLNPERLSWPAMGKQRVPLKGFIFCHRPDLSPLHRWCARPSVSLTGSAACREQGSNLLSTIPSQGQAQDLPFIQWAWVILPTSRARNEGCQANSKWQLLGVQSRWLPSKHVRNLPFALSSTWWEGGKCGLAKDAKLAFFQECYLTVKWVHFKTLKTFRLQRITPRKEMLLKLMHAMLFTLR